MKELHSKQQNQFEASDKKMFGKVVILAGAALLLLLLAGLLIVGHLGRHLGIAHPQLHPTSQLKVGRVEDVA